MKNLKIALILLAVVAIFSSCKKDEDETTATANGLKLTVTSSIGNELSTANMDEVLPTDFTVTVNASEETNGLKSITGAVYGIWKGGISEDHQEGDLEEIISAEDFNTLYVDGVFKKKDKTFSAEIPFNLTKANVETYASWCKAIRVTVTAVSNAKEPETLTRECNITLTVAEPAPSFSESTFEWKRDGSNYTGLDVYGLQWDANSKTVYANIKPLANAKLYQLTAAEYAATSVSDIDFSNEISVYRGIGWDAAGTYNDVIASVYNGKTYVFHITSSTMTPNPNTGGYIFTINGDVKTFEATPEAK